MENFKKQKYSNLGERDKTNTDKHTKTVVKRKQNSTTPTKMSKHFIRNV